MKGDDRVDFNWVRKSKTIWQKTKRNQWTNHDSKQLHVADAMSGKNSSKRVTIDFGFTSDWMTWWREFFMPIV